MDFELSDDQLALRDGARELLAGRASIDRVRAIMEVGGGIDAELWKAMVHQGWTAVELPEDRGGLGLGTVEIAVLLEEVGRHVAPAPFLQTVLALGALERAGEHERVDRLLSSVGAACVAWSARPDAVRADADGAAWALSGQAGPVPYAPSADLAIVVASAPDGPALFALDLAELGRPAREPALDQTRELGWLDLSGAPAIRLGGAAAVDDLLDRAAAGASAEMLGSATRALDMAVEYAKDRVQFGRPIGSFQAVKHRCADMLVDVEGMRSTVYWAAWCIGAGDPDASIAASTAKIWCSDAAKRVMSSALQVHGGIGFTWEHDLHLFLKRSQLDQVSFGDASFHRQRLTAMLRPRVEAGESVI
jgi:alkylation response protein AidB-like acyl-CoA dehydrogenase